MCQACATAERHAKHLHDLGDKTPGRVSMVRDNRRPGERIIPWSP